MRELWNRFIEIILSVTIAKRWKAEVPAVEQLLLRIERAAHPFAALGLGVSQLQAATCAEACHDVAH